MRLGPIGADEFAGLMAPLGPFATAPRIAVAVSGGADSRALALLAQAWARERGGQAIGLIVDHGLRTESGEEARATAASLAQSGMDARILTLTGLRGGAALAERARAARYAALEAECARLGLIDLLLGHHAADQAETLLIRAGAGSGRAGLAGMAALREGHAVRFLRPLLGMPHGRLRATLRAAGIAWVEDPSNRDPVSQRARLRGLRADPEGDAPATAALAGLAGLLGRERAARGAAVAGELAARAEIHPEGWALLTPGPIGAAALAALLRAIGGRAFAASETRISALAAAPGPATLGGVRLMAAGRMGAGWLVLREVAAIAPEAPAVAGTVWDGRFRLRGTPPAGLTVGALGAAAARFRDRRGLPSAILRSLPALRRAREVVAVPLLGYGPRSGVDAIATVFAPAEAIAGAAFFSSHHGCASRRGTLC